MGDLAGRYQFKMCKKSEKIQIIRIFHIISYFDFSEFF